MNIQSMSVSMEKYVMPLANKLGNEIHLRAIRDAFMSLLPITFTGGIAAVLSSAPSVDAAGTGITLAWARFMESNSMIFSWINALTLGAMSLYICIGIISIANSTLSFNYIKAPESIAVHDFVSKQRKLVMKSVWLQII